MNIKGKLIAKLTPEVGESSKGKWTKQVVIIETAETYPKKICISFWKENVIKIQATPIGAELVIDVNIESREYSGKWYSEIKAWRFTANEETVQGWKFTANGQAVNVETPKNDKTITENEEPNLPF